MEVIMKKKSLIFFVFLFFLTIFVFAQSNDEYEENDKTEYSYEFYRDDDFSIEGYGSSQSIDKDDPRWEEESQSQETDDPHEYRGGVRFKWEF
jgi:hypothetical protein